MEPPSVGLFGIQDLKEVVTPHKLSLLSMVYEYSLMKTTSDFSNFTQKQMRDFMTCILKLLQSPDVPLQDLLTTFRVITKQTLQEVFSQRLKEFYSEGVSPIMDFFQKLSDLLTPDGETIISKTSVLGIFIRRMVLAFEKLSFSQVISLYGQFKLYYEAVYTATPLLTEDENGELSKSISELSMSLPSFQTTSRTNLTKNLEALTLNEGYGKEITGGFYSQKQAEYFISQQVFFLQHNENEALPPKKLQQKISEILKANPDLTEVHFLSYLNQLRVKEYVTALHSHFHYFDRHTFTSPDAKVKDDDVGRRYAALNLASLHFRYSHRKESLTALREAIQLAQESNDHICLQHALGWLYRLGEQAEGTIVHLMQRSVAKSGDLNLPYLTSLGVQAFARHKALSAAQPSSIFEFLLKSDILNCQHSQSKFICVSTAQKAALWTMYGKREMTSMASQLVLHLDTSDGGVYHSGESDIISLCNLARAHTDQGCYTEALEMIDKAKKHAPPTSQHAHIWMQCEQEVKFTKALFVENWNEADEAVRNLQAVNLHEAHIRKILLMKEKGETTSVLTLVNRLLNEVSKRTDGFEGAGEQVVNAYKCRLLLLLSELFCQTGTPLAAIPHLLECLTESRRYHLQYLSALAGVFLAYVQFCMELPNQALTILTEHMVVILANGSVFDQARVLFLYGKCQAAASKKSTHEQRKSDLMSVVSMMSSVIDMFSRVDAQRRVKNVLYFQTRLYHELGYTSEKYQSARKFRQLDQTFPTISPVLLNGI